MARRFTVGDHKPAATRGGGHATGALVVVFKHLLEPGKVGRHGIGVSLEVLVAHTGGRRSVNTTSHAPPSAITRIGL